VVTDETGDVIFAQHRWDERRRYVDQDALDAAQFVRATAARLPPELRIQAGWDVVKLTSGKWKVIERNIFEVGDAYPDINTLAAQLIAAKKVGITPLQSSFRSFLQADGLAAKDVKFAEFLDHPAIRELMKTRDAMTEYLLAAKNSYLAELRAPPVESINKVIASIKRFNLQDQLTADDIKRIADLVPDRAFRVRELAEKLTGRFDLFYIGPSGRSELMLLDYDGRYVEERLAILLEPFKDRPASELLRIIEETASREVIVAEEIWADPKLAAQASNAREVALRTSKKLAYRGRRTTLVRSIERRLRNLPAPPSS